MTVRPYHSDDYPTVLAWWLMHGVTPTPEDCLPRLGVMIEDNDRAILAAWASMDNSCGLAFLLFPVSAPKAPARSISKALTHSVAYLTTVLTELGYHTILSATHRASLSRHLARHGFTHAQPVHFQTLALTPPCLS